MLRRARSSPTPPTYVGAATRRTSRSAEGWGMLRRHGRTTFPRSQRVARQQGSTAKHRTPNPGRATSRTELGRECLMQWCNSLGGQPHKHVVSNIATQAQASGQEDRTGERQGADVISFDRLGGHAATGMINQKHRRGSGQAGRRASGDLGGLRAQRSLRRRREPVGVRRSMETPRTKRKRRIQLIRDIPLEVAGKYTSRH